MSDINPEQYSEFTTEDGPDSADVEQRGAQEHPAHEAHGGSMAPGLVDDTGHRTSEAVPGESDQ
jgi:hypothetical protein